MLPTLLNPATVVDGDIAKIRRLLQQLTLLNPAAVVDVDVDWTWQLLQLPTLLNLAAIAAADVVEPGGYRSRWCCWTGGDRSCQPFWTLRLLQLLTILNSEAAADADTTGRLGYRAKWSTDVMTNDNNSCLVEEKYAFQNTLRYLK